LANAQATALATAIPPGPQDNTSKIGQFMPESKHPIHEAERFKADTITLAAERYNELCQENDRQRAELERIGEEHEIKLKRHNTDYDEVEKDYLLLQKRITDLKKEHAMNLDQVKREHAAEKARWTQNSSTSTKMRQQIVELQANLKITKENWRLRILNEISTTTFTSKRPTVSKRKSRIGGTNIKSPAILSPTLNPNF
jgi:hypothetical protein